MKYTWELSDIQVGIRSKNKENDEVLIGWRFADDPKDKTIFYIISLIGGHILKITVNKEDIVKYLNKHNYIPAKTKT